MNIGNQLLVYVILAMAVALVVSFLMTPVVKTFAYKVGAIDVPKDARRMHKVPIPRLGGLAIFIGFMVSILLFLDIRGNPQMQSILLGAVVIVVLGVVDDIMACLLYTSGSKIMLKKGRFYDVLCAAYHAGDSVCRRI